MFNIFKKEGNFIPFNIDLNINVNNILDFLIIYEKNKDSYKELLELVYDTSSKREKIYKELYKKYEEELLLDKKNKELIIQKYKTNGEKYEDIIKNYKKELNSDIDCIKDSSLKYMGLSHFNKIKEEFYNINFQFITNKNIFFLKQENQYFSLNTFNNKRWLFRLSINKDSEYFIRVEFNFFGDFIFSIEKRIEEWRDMGLPHTIILQEYEIPYMETYYDSFIFQRNNGSFHLPKNEKAFNKFCDLTEKIIEENPLSFGGSRYSEAWEHDKSIWVLENKMITFEISPV